jgi:SAM-dependent methyltransferase
VADQHIPRAAADGFGSGADAYESARPSYPPDAVAEIVRVCGLGPGRRVLDLAAGTGKLTRLLVPTGAEVVAVEPVAAMREVLTAVVPGVEALDGTAEAVPLPDASVDAVTVAQAFHWFDPPVALAEIARVLRPGGTLVLVWNTRDRSVDWVQRWSDLLVEGDGDRPFDRYVGVDYAAVVAADGGGAFTPVERWATSWVQPSNPELLLERSASVSVVAALPADERAAVLDRVRELTRSHPDLAERPSFGFPYDTTVWSCRRV